MNCTYYVCELHGHSGFIRCPKCENTVLDGIVYVKDINNATPYSIEQGKKYDDGKPRTDLLPPLALMEVAKVMAFGAKKYGDHNWRGGLKYSRLIAATLRHTWSFLAGNDCDKETGISHLAHAACCILMLLDFVLSGRESLDDRYKEKK